MTPQAWPEAFLASPTVRGVMDTYGLESIHPMRAGRSLRHIGRQGLAKHRGIVGGTWCLLLNQDGVVVAWDGATAHVPDTPCQWLMRQCDERRMVCSDTAFHAAEGAPANRTRCPRGTWNDRMLLETVLSMLTLVRHCKQGMHRVWEYCQARLACTMAALHVLVQWYGFPPDAHGFVPLSIAAFSL